MDSRSFASRVQVQTFLIVIGQLVLTPLHLLHVLWKLEHQQLSVITATVPSAAYSSMEEKGSLPCPDLIAIGVDCILKANGAGNLWQI